MDDLGLYGLILPSVVLLPVLTALLCLLRQSARFSGALGILAASVQTLLVVWLCRELVSVSDGISNRYTLGGWGAPLGIDLAINGFSAVLLLTIAVINFFACLYSKFYFKELEMTLRFWPLWWFLMAGLNALALSADAFNIYVALEMIGLSSVALIGLAGTKPALVAALRYALVGLLGSLCYLLGVALLYRLYGTLDLAMLKAAAQLNTPTAASLTLISVGLLMKSALLPLHFWLPPAHSGAPAPVSAILSALVVKASFYLLVRFWFDVLPVGNVNALLYFIGALGSLAIVFGCIAALRTERLKLLVAYSTVAQIGYLFLIFPIMAAVGGNAQLKQSALEAVLYFVVAHAFAKAAMFLSAGQLQKDLGHDTIANMHGVVSVNPLAVLAFAIAGFSLVGLPPSGGFIAKWLMLNAAIQNGLWILVFVMLVGGLLAATYVCKLLNVAFSQNKASSAFPLYPEQNRGRSALSAGALGLAGLAIVLGFNAEWVIALMRIGMFELVLGGVR